MKENTEMMIRILLMIFASVANLITAFSIPHEGNLITFLIPEIYLMASFYCVLLCITQR